MKGIEAMAFDFLGGPLRREGEDCRARPREPDLQDSVWPLLLADQLILAALGMPKTS